VSWLLAFVGFAALIVLHELGHFAAAKWVGMRVERFALFFPPLAWKVRRGETEYAVGTIPLGGYVKITGMNPAEDIPPEVAHRAYFRQPVWKRVVVILAGPLVNIVIAFAIFVGLFWSSGTVEPPPRVASIEAGSPAAGVLRPGDAIVAVDGRRPPGDTFAEQQDFVVRQIGTHRCAGTPSDGCRAAQPVQLTIGRGGQERTVAVTPFFDARQDVRRMRIGFAPDGTPRDLGPGGAAQESAEQMWAVTRGTVTTLAGIFKADERKKINGVVVSYEATRQAFKLSLESALMILGLISLSLGVINLFPFLPLDGGHIFWAVAEKVRGRAIPFSVMERAGFVGFALVLMLFAVGLTNDIGQLQNGGVRLR
jgi:regulator of sigma E protease